MPVAGDVGKTIQVVVTATNNNGSTPATSNQTATVSASGGGGSTFGASAAGSSTASPGSGYKFGSPYPLSATATATAFEFYASGGSSSQSFTPAIYTSSGSAPANLVVSGQTVTIAAGQAAGWVSATLPSTSLPAGTYYLVLVSGLAGQGANVYYAAGGASDGVYNKNTPGTPTATFGASSTEPRQWSYRVRLGP